MGGKRRRNQTRLPDSKATIEKRISLLGVRKPENDVVKLSNDIALALNAKFGTTTIPLIPLTPSKPLNKKLSIAYLVSVCLLLIWIQYLVLSFNTPDDAVLL